MHCLSQQIKFEIICIKQAQLADTKVYLMFQTVTFQWEIIKLGWMSKALPGYWALLTNIFQNIVFL